MPAFPLFCFFQISYIDFVINFPRQLVLGTIYLVIVYIITGQPLEFSRGIKFFATCYLCSLIGESMGCAIGTTLSIVVRNNFLFEILKQRGSVKKTI